MTPLHGWLRRRGRALHQDERSNSLAMIIATLPLIIGVFGMGIDVARNVYIRSSLQNSLELAVVSGAGATFINGERAVEIDPARAEAAINTVYAANRATGPGPLVCQAGPHCWRQMGASRIRRDSVRWRIREVSRNAFLPILGLHEQRYVLDAYAQVRQQTR